MIARPITIEVWEYGRRFAGFGHHWTARLIGHAQDLVGPSAQTRRGPTREMAISSLVSAVEKEIGPVRPELIQRLGKTIDPKTLAKQAAARRKAAIQNAS